MTNAKNKFLSPIDEQTSTLQKRVEALFSKYRTPVSEDEIAVCVPSYKLRKNNHIDLLAGFKHVYIFVMAEEYDMYSARFPWATCVKRVSTTMGKCRNEIVEYITKLNYTYFMLVDDDICWREYYYPVDSATPKTRYAKDPTEIYSMLVKNTELMEKLGADVMFFDKGGFTTAKLENRLNFKFGSPTFQAVVYRTSIFKDPKLRFTEDITVPEDDAMNELIQYLGYKYIKAIDFLVGNIVEGEKLFKSETSTTVVNYISHDALYARVKKFRAEKKALGFLQALRNYGYPSLE